MTLQNSIFAPTPLSVANGGTGNHTTLANGQLWIGNGTAIPGISNIIPGSGITIDYDNETGNITVDSLVDDITWNGTGTNISIIMAPNTGYIVSGSVGVPTFYTPIDAAVGDTYSIMGSLTTGFAIWVAASSSQMINYNGFGGTKLSTTSDTASITLICTQGTSPNQIFGVVNISNVITDFVLV